ncbi:response regulator [Pseudomonas yamanorum]|uniref:response regulator n=1 Tax=Pseudomonas yamanorum TaxID=515393 RepID=UPI0038508082
MNNRVLVVDDHPAVRTTVRLILEGEGYEVVGEADNGVDALAQMQALNPDILILDIGIPRIDGLAVVSHLKAQCSPVIIIILTAQSEHHISSRCVQAGVHGFINKSSELSELVSAIRAVEAGYHYFPSEMFTLVCLGASHEGDKDMLNSLTTRELTILQQLAQGLSNKQIARRMFLSDKTISTYKTRLLVKLNASTLLDLYELAKRNGLTER